MRSTPGFHPKKFFLNRCNYSFCKLDRFIIESFFLSIEQRSNLQQELVKKYLRMTFGVNPGVDLINFFGMNLLTLFCKLDHFIAICKNCLFIK